MTKYLLIIIYMSTLNAPYQPAPIEFDNKDSCEGALAYIRKGGESNVALPIRLAFCAPKDLSRQ